MANFLSRDETWRTFVISDIVWSYYSLVYFGFFGFSIDFQSDDSEL